jgi:Ca2+-binding RTX toxin-like protein
MATPDDNSVTDPPFDPSSNLDEAVRGLLQGGSWIFTGPRLLTYSLHSDTLLASWSDAQTVAVDRAFAAWAAVANIQFKRVAGPTDYTLTAADLAITISADLASVYPGATAVGVFPDPAYANTLLLGLGMGRFSYPHPEGDIFLNVFATELNYFSPGGAGFAVGLHEIGHALGLKHPFDDGGNLRPTFAELGIGALDNGLDTVMSYNDAFPSSPSYANSYQITPMALDILAIQRIYGANMSYHTGNDTYRLLNDSMVRAVWDAGGIDTFDASALKSAVTIENAIGGTGNDSLTGNAADNRLDGRAGADVMTGGLGNDTYVLDNAGDVVTENLNEGTDTVQASISYTLGPNLENLTLTGTAAINGTGNGLDNVITGNAAANVLDGGAGADTLIGGAGADTYVVDNPGDTVSELSTVAGVIDTVLASVGFTLGANLENLTLTGSGNIDGTGNGLANVLSGNAGINVLAGGAGNDTYIVNTAGDTVVETSAVATEIDLVQSSVSFTLGHNLENLTLTGPADIDGSGNGLANTIQGNDGANVLDGGAGADTLKGGKGDDTYRVDLVKSGTVAVLQDVVTENLNEGTDDTLTLRTAGALGLAAATTLTLGANLENLDASATGSTKLNLTGNAGNNILTGNDWDNILNGGLGNDTLIGGAGNDSFTGGAGNDTFVIERVASMVAAISDFEAGIDKLGLGQTAYSALFTGGALKAGVFDNGAAATTVTQWLFYNAGSGGLFYDSDGTGVVAAVQVATLSHKPALTASDFVLVAGS